MIANSKPFRTLLLIVLAIGLALVAEMLIGWDALTVLAVETLVIACYAAA